ncbi:MAG: serine/threonine-protein phosphatase, partial [Acidobacteriaceae bacterium]|nr:serine/threonine-protein phosphatase [Acidobacteriaceae bacterium]
CFITFFIAEIDAASGEICYSNAGHNAPIIMRANGNAERLGPTGLILGIAPDAQYEEKTAHLNPGDTLLLFSDGVTEPHNPDLDEEFGEERLVSLLKEVRLHSAVHVIEAVRREVAGFTGGAPASDDMTLVVARRV